MTKTQRSSSSGPIYKRTVRGITPSTTVVQPASFAYPTATVTGLRVDDTIEVNRTGPSATGQVILGGFCTAANVLTLIYGNMMTAITTSFAYSVDIAIFR